LRAEFFASLPYAARGNLALIRHLLPAMLVMQVYQPDRGERPSLLSLQENGRLRIDGQPSTFDLSKARPLFGFMRALGAWTSPSLVVQVPTGHAIHYAGTLPMTNNPGTYQCSVDGRLHPTRRVYVADSATFARLPAKNMSFGMMANAMRVAAGVAQHVRASA
jgi:choline dehydrogenase-like flavoprotein